MDRRDKKRSAGRQPLRALRYRGGRVVDELECVRRMDQVERPGDLVGETLYGREDEADRDASPARGAPGVGKLGTGDVDRGAVKPFAGEEYGVLAAAAAQLQGAHPATQRRKKAQTRISWNLRPVMEVVARYPHYVLIFGGKPVPIGTLEILHSHCAKAKIGNRRQREAMAQIKNHLRGNSRSRANAAPKIAPAKPTHSAVKVSKCQGTVSVP